MKPAMVFAVSQHSEDIGEQRKLSVIADDMLDDEEEDDDDVHGIVLRSTTMADILRNKR